MIQKSSFSLFVFAVLVMFVAAPMAMAQHNCPQHSYSWGKSDCQCAKANKSKGLSDKFFNKARFFAKNQDEIGLTDDQIETIKALKHDLKKKLITLKAETDILSIDIKASLHGHKIDVKGTNALLEKKYELKKVKAQSLVKALAQLKEMLSAEQYQKVKDLHKKQAHKKHHACGGNPSCMSHFPAAGF